MVLLHSYCATLCYSPVSVCLSVTRIVLKSLNASSQNTFIAVTPFKVIQGHRLWYQSKAHIRLPISD